MKKLPLLVKAVVLGLMALLLLVPLSMVDGLVSERMHRQHQVEAEIANSTAKPQLLAGPIITVHYTESWVDKVVEQKTNGDTLWNESRDVEFNTTYTKHIFPERLLVNGQLLVEPRKRGIFEARVYSLDSKLTGRWQLPSIADLAHREGSEITINSAVVSLLVSDRKGFMSQPTLTINGAGASSQGAKPRKQSFKPGSQLAGWGAGVHADITNELIDEPQRLEFDVSLLLQGTSRFAVAPLADDNQLTLIGSWPHPSFDGQFLPVDRDISDSKFKASWRVTSMASSAQNQLQSELTDNSLQLSGVDNMGVSLIDPVSVYSNTDRALKYGFLFVGLTFASFFLYELLMRLRIHPVQYGLVGVAQALFFLLLLSFSEHLGFAAAYLVAAIACVGIITFYLFSVLQSRVRGLSFAFGLAGLYGILYLLLQSEDYALLGGSLVLFALLAGAMVITRKLDWYGLEAQLVAKAQNGQK